MQSSPGSPTGISLSPVSTSTILHSVSGKGIPQLSGLRKPSTVWVWVVGDVSLSPYPCLSTRPVRASNLSITSSGSGAEPLLKYLTDEKSICAARGWLSSETYSVGTPGKTVGRYRSKASTTNSTSYFG